MSASFATLPNRHTPAGDAYGHRPLSAIAAAASGGVPQARIRRVLADLAAPLAELHANGRVHGAIAMSTVGLDTTGKAHLLVPPLEPTADAEGGARMEGYAAFEQYTDDPERPCGPWTDIYALSALAHSLLVGFAPPAALARCVKDTYEPLAGRDLGAYDPGFLQAVDRGLSMKHAARPQDMDAFAQAFELAPAPVPQPPAETPALAPDPEPALPPVAAAAKPAPGPRVPLLVLLGVLAAVAFAVYLWLRPEATAPQSARQDPAPAEAPTAPPPQAPVPTPPALSDLNAPREAGPAALPAEGTAPAVPPAQEPAAAPPAPAQPPSAAAPTPAPADAASPSAGSLSAAPGQAPGEAETPEPPAANPVPGENPPGAPAVAAATPEAGGQAGAAESAPADAAAATGATAEDAASAEGAASAEAADAAAAPEEAPPASVAVRVHVQPWGEVLVDGRSRGISPPLTELTLTPGRHRVTIRNPAAPDYETSINVSAGGSAAISHVFE